MHTKLKKQSGLLQRLQKSLGDNQRHLFLRPAQRQSLDHKRAEGLVGRQGAKGHRANHGCLPGDPKALAVKGSEPRFSNQRLFGKGHAP